jgi:hypothetical protein
MPALACYSAWAALEELHGNQSPRAVPHHQHLVHTQAVEQPCGMEESWGLSQERGCSAASVWWKGVIMLDYQH